jgi:hypothetical protein
VADRAGRVVKMRDGKVVGDTAAEHLPAPDAATTG